MLDKLQPRERAILLGGGAIVITLLLFVLGQMLAQRLSVVGDTVSQRRAQYQEIQRLKQQISSMDPAGTVPADSDFLNLINRTLQKNSIAASISGKAVGKGRDEEYRVSIRLNNVPLDGFLNFLYEVEYQMRLPVRVDSLRINKGTSNQSVYDVNLDIALATGK